MTSIRIQPVLLAGGSGTRLWPLSRVQHPKQFLVLKGKTSLFQQAAHRLSSLSAADIGVSAPCVVGNEDLRFLLRDQLQELDITAGAVLLEPLGRNTAPAMTMAALYAQSNGDDPVLVVSPSDQTVDDEVAFVSALQTAARAAAAGSIVILGVAPDRPETGFGYIRTDAPATDTGSFSRSSEPAQLVTQFVEKPDLATAERYLKAGHYYWNSGMFVVRASVWLSALEQFRPDIAAASKLAWAARTVDAGFTRPGRTEFAAIPSESVDCAVMEKCPAHRGGSGEQFDIRMVSLAAGWSDLGAWEALWRSGVKDDNGNVSAGDTLVSDSRNCLAHGTSRLVALVGLEDVVVVETPDAVLVVDRSRSEGLKEVVGRLQRAGRREATLNRQVHRPWGWYDSIDSGARFQVKRIVVNPGASLSLQMHHHRAEHWIVVSGTAKVTVGDEETILSENKSIYIPLGTTHRLTNPGKIPLEIIEVQTGSYLGEDDIVRFEDVYGRST